MGIGISPCLFSLIKRFISFFPQTIDTIINMLGGIYPVILVPVKLRSANFFCNAKKIIDAGCLNFQIL